MSLPVHRKPTKHPRKNIQSKQSIVKSSVFYYFCRTNYRAVNMCEIRVRAKYAISDAGLRSSKNIWTHASAKLGAMVLRLCHGGEMYEGLLRMHARSAAVADLLLGACRDMGGMLPCRAIGCSVVTCLEKETRERKRKNVPFALLLFISNVRSSVHNTPC